MSSFLKLKTNYSKTKNNFKEIKLAIVSDNSSQFMTQAIKAYGIKYQLNLDIFESNYNQIDFQLLNFESPLYKFKPEFIYINFSTQKLLNQFYKTDIINRNSFSDNKINEIQNIYEAINSKIKSTIIINNFNEINDHIFGNYSNKSSVSFIYQLRKINFCLMNLLQKSPNMFICDFVSIQNNIGIKMIDQKLYYNADLAYSIKSVPYIAKNILKIICSNIGIFKKCLILDLDNTLWGGVIGDDGIDGIKLGGLGIGSIYTELQRWVLELKKRGILITICSKNNFKIAKKAFKEHPEMILKMSDISIFKANWKDKTENIYDIKKELNIDFNSMVFIDDNPFEREMVKKNLPLIEVPDLPNDPSDYLQFLRTENYFETSSFIKDDSKKTTLYKEEIKRSEKKGKFKNKISFLKHLNMKSKVDVINSKNIDRVFQLMQRTNQFNTRRKRYTKSELENFSANKNAHTMVFKLYDKFGNYGIISCVILEKINKNLIIDTWVLSCRVFDRGLENFIIKKIITYAKCKSCKSLIGFYEKTEKNILIKSLFTSLGFKKIKDKWILSLEKKFEYDSQINLITN
jgi:FkbH-like protein